MFAKVFKHSGYYLFFLLYTPRSHLCLDLLDGDICHAVLQYSHLWLQHWYLQVLTNLLLIYMGHPSLNEGWKSYFLSTCLLVELPFLSTFLSTFDAFLSTHGGFLLPFHFWTSRFISTIWTFCWCIFSFGPYSDAHRDWGSCWYSHDQVWR